MESLNLISEEDHYNVLIRMAVLSEKRQKYFSQAAKFYIDYMWKKKSRILKPEGPRTDPEFIKTAEECKEAAYKWLNSKIDFELNWDLITEEQSKFIIGICSPFYK